MVPSSVASKGDTSGTWPHPRIRDLHFRDQGQSPGSEIRIMMMVDSP
jgi:hypothetical protein